MPSTLTHKNYLILGNFGPVLFIPTFLRFGLSNKQRKRALSPTNAMQLRRNTKGLWLERHKKLMVKV